ncbi:MAG: helix-hairpin-helix domain-containing protein [Sphaerochaetaceae bacterium]|jgi:predicted DNA-binding helix-hairpin-helix protein|nr:helix-hairpin-helix domain-containing protein [Sphaerochaetaceae bacterium]MDX9939230.1 helix-hairpin-helix domain-containing protein [Sphaerochaetaceae bacterium]
MDTASKLDILARDAQYDLSCACSTKRPEEHRKRTDSGSWLYPVTVASGGSGIMLKTLMSNMCTNDCKYCPLRECNDTSRISLQPEELARFFMQLQAQRNLIGIFLSSGVIGSPDKTMDRLVATAQLLRKQYRYRGYIHIKMIPGASHAAMDAALSLASAVSLNIETPGAAHCAKLSGAKDYEKDIIGGLTYISEKTAPASPYARVNKTSQFIVGASDESDKEILAYTWGMYRRLDFDRLYYSAYQAGLGDPSIPGERHQMPSVLPSDMLPLAELRMPQGNPAILMREHRLYQADFLFRQYGFTYGDLFFDHGGNLDLSVDPKLMWAQRNPDRFPVSLSRASKEDLLRVPGIGPVMAKKIVAHRKHTPISSLESLRLPEYLLERAKPYLVLH